MSHAVAMPSVMFGSPKDWDDWFWASYRDFLEYLHAACYPDGVERWIKHSDGRTIEGAPRG